MAQERLPGLDGPAAVGVGDLCDSVRPTTHGATWAKRIAKMPAGQARSFLQSCMGMPGSAWLGTEAGRQKQLRRQPPDESGPSALELGEGVAPGEWVRVAGSDEVGWLCVDPSKTSNRYWLMTPDGHGEQWLDEGRVELAAAPGRPSREDRVVVN